MTIIQEGRYPGECIVSEGDHGISRDTILLARHSLTYKSGEVLGQVTISRKYTHLAPAASDGSQTAAAILHQERDATAADTKGVALRRLVQVKDKALVWPAGITDEQKRAAIGHLDARAIVVRS